MIVSGYNNQVSQHQNHHVNNVGSAAQAGSGAVFGGFAVGQAASSQFSGGDSQPGSHNFASMIHGFAENFGGLF